MAALDDPECIVGDFLTNVDFDYAMAELSSFWNIDSSLPAHSKESSFHSHATQESENVNISKRGFEDIFSYCRTENMLMKDPVPVSYQQNVIGCSKAKKGSLKKGQRYTSQFKREVLDYAVRHTYKETAKKFRVNVNTLTDWAREYKRLDQLKKSTTKKPGSEPKTDLSFNPTASHETESEGTEQSASAKFIKWLRLARQQRSQLSRDDVVAAGLAFVKAEVNQEQDWFINWVRRIKEPKSAATHHADKHIFYPDSFKLEVALYAKQYTKKKAADTFGVSSRRVYAWCSPDSATTSNDTQAKRLVESQLKIWYEAELESGCKPKGRELMAKARVLYAANGLKNIKCSQGWLEKFQKRYHLKISHVHDEKLLMWILSKLDDNYSPKVTEITETAQRLATESNMKDFKGSKGWTLRFLKRHSPLLQNSSARLDLMPAAVKTHARIFCRALNERIYAAGLASDSIGCMDELAITFHFPTETVPTPRLLRHVSLDSCAAVVLLSATSDGRLLPPAVVFKGSSFTQQMLFAETIPVIYQEKGRVDITVLRQWFPHVWLRSVKPPSILVVDSYGPHRSVEFQKLLSTGNCHLGLIPPACAMNLQPCGFNLSRRFQEAVQEQWHTGDSWSKNSGRTVPDEKTILYWILKAYREIRVDRTSIISSFQLSGLTSSSTIESSPNTLTSCTYIKKTDEQV